MLSNNYMMIANLALLKAVFALFFTDIVRKKNSLTKREIKQFDNNSLHIIYVGKIVCTNNIRRMHKE